MMVGIGEKAMDGPRYVPGELEEVGRKWRADTVGCMKKSYE